MLKALFRLIEPLNPDSALLIDGIDVTKIGLQDLRNQLTLIGDSFIFPGSIRDNLDPNGSSSDGELWVALEAVKLNHLVSFKSEGLDYVIDARDEEFGDFHRKL